MAGKASASSGSSGGGSGEGLGVLVERVDVAHPAIQRMAVQALFDRVRSSRSTSLGLSSSQGRQAVAACLCHSSSVVVEEAVSCLCDAVRDKALRAEEATDLLLGALLAVGVEGLLAVCSGLARLRRAHSSTLRSTTHPYSIILESRDDAQGCLLIEISHDVLLPLRLHDPASSQTTNLPLSLDPQLQPFLFDALLPPSLPVPRLRFKGALHTQLVRLAAGAPPPLLLQIAHVLLFTLPWVSLASPQEREVVHTSFSELADLLDSCATSAAIPAHAQAQLAHHLCTTGLALCHELCRSTGSSSGAGGSSGVAGGLGGGGEAAMAILRDVARVYRGAVKPWFRSVRDRGAGVGGGGEEGVEVMGREDAEVLASLCGLLLAAVGAAEDFQCMVLAMVGEVFRGKNGARALPPELAPSFPIFPLLQLLACPSMRVRKLVRQCLSAAEGAASATAFMEPSRQPAAVADKSQRHDREEEMGQVLLAGDGSAEGKDVVCLSAADLCVHSQQMQCRVSSELAGRLHGALDGAGERSLLLGATNTWADEPVEEWNGRNSCRGKNGGTAEAGIWVSEDEEEEEVDDEWFGTEVGLLSAEEEGAGVLCEGGTGGLGGESCATALAWLCGVTRHLKATRRAALAIAGRHTSAGSGVDPGVFLSLASIIFPLTRSYDPTTQSAATKALGALGECEPIWAFSLLPPVLRLVRQAAESGGESSSKAVRSITPSQKAYHEAEAAAATAATGMAQQALSVMRCLPSLASHWLVAGPIVQSLRPLTAAVHTHSAAAAVATRLMADVWRACDRTYPFLETLLRPSAVSAAAAATGGARPPPRAVQLAVAASVRDVCLRDSGRAVDLVLTLQACIESSDPILCALGLDSLALLCQDDAVDFFTAWKVVARTHKAMPTHPIAAASWCGLLRHGCLDAAMHPDATVEIISLLWHAWCTGLLSAGNKGHEEGQGKEEIRWRSVRKAAYASLAAYDVDVLHDQKLWTLSSRDIVTAFVTEPAAQVRRAGVRLLWKLLALEHRTRPRGRAASAATAAVAERFSEAKLPSHTLIRAAALRLLCAADLVAAVPGVAQFGASEDTPLGKKRAAAAAAAAAAASTAAAGSAAAVDSAGATLLLLGSPQVESLMLAPAATAAPPPLSAPATKPGALSDLTAAQSLQEREAVFQHAFLEACGAVSRPTNLPLYMLALKSWKGFMGAWYRLRCRLLMEQPSPASANDSSNSGSSSTAGRKEAPAADATAEAAAVAMTSELLRTAFDGTPTESENSLLALAGLCQNLPPALHRIVSRTTETLLSSLADASDSLALGGSSSAGSSGISRDIQAAAGATSSLSPLAPSSVWAVAAALGGLLECLHPTDWNLRRAVVNTLAHVLRSPAAVQCDGGALQLAASLALASAACTVHSTATFPATTSSTSVSAAASGGGTGFLASGRSGRTNAQVLLSDVLSSILSYLTRESPSLKADLEGVVSEHPDLGIRLGGGRSAAGARSGRQQEGEEELVLPEEEEVQDVMDMEFTRKRESASTREAAGVGWGVTGAVWALGAVAAAASSRSRSGGGGSLGAAAGESVESGGGGAGLWEGGIAGTAALVSSSQGSQLAASVAEVLFDWALAGLRQGVGAGQPKEEAGGDTARELQGQEYTEWADDVEGEGAREGGGMNAPESDAWDSAGRRVVVSPSIVIGSLLGLPEAFASAYRLGLMPAARVLSRFRSMLEAAKTLLSTSRLAWDRPLALLLGHVLICLASLVNTLVLTGLPLPCALVSSVVALLSQASQPGQQMALRLASTVAVAELLGAAAMAVRPSAPDSSALFNALGLKSLFDSSSLDLPFGQPPPPAGESSQLTGSADSSGPALSTDPYVTEALASVSTPLLLDEAAQEAAHAAVQRLVEAMKRDADAAVRRHAGWALALCGASLEGLLRLVSVEQREREAEAEGDSEAVARGVVGFGPGGVTTPAWRRFPVLQFADGTCVKALMVWLVGAARALVLGGQQPLSTRTNVSPTAVASALMALSRAPRIPALDWPATLSLLFRYCNSLLSSSANDHNPKSSATTHFPISSSPTPTNPTYTPVSTTNITDTIAALELASACIRFAVSHRVAEFLDEVTEGPQLANLAPSLLQQIVSRHLAGILPLFSSARSKQLLTDLLDMIAFAEPGSEVASARARSGSVAAAAAGDGDVGGGGGGAGHGYNGRSASKLLVCVKQQANLRACLWLGLARMASIARSSPHSTVAAAVGSSGDGGVSEAEVRACAQKLLGMLPLPRVGTRTSGRDGRENGEVSSSMWGELRCGLWPLEGCREWRAAVKCLSRMDPACLVYLLEVRTELLSMRAQASDAVMHSHRHGTADGGSKSGIADADWVASTVACAMRLLLARRRVIPAADVIVCRSFLCTIALPDGAHWLLAEAASAVAAQTEDVQRRWVHDTLDLVHRCRQPCQALHLVGLIVSRLSPPHLMLSTAIPTALLQLPLSLPSLLLRTGWGPVVSPIVDRLRALLLAVEDSSFPGLLVQQQQQQQGATSNVLHVTTEQLSLVLLQTLVALRQHAPRSVVQQLVWRAWARNAQ